jgi:hypothetical protein
MVIMLVMHIILLLEMMYSWSAYRHSLASYGLINTARGISHRSLSVYSSSMLQILLFYMLFCYIYFNTKLIVLPPFTGMALLAARRS